MSETSQVTQIVDKMWQFDAFSQWLGIERMEESLGFCQLKMKVRPEMLNGFGITHGGILFSLADSAFAFASNSEGQYAVSIESSISIFHPTKAGEYLVATANRLSSSNKLAHYEVRITNESGKELAFFKGTVYKKRERW